MDAGKLVSAPVNDLAGLLGDIERIEATFASWAEPERGAVGAYRDAVDALHAEVPGG